MSVSRLHPRDYTVQTLRALDAVIVLIWAGGELVATFWDADLDQAAIQAGTFVGTQLSLLAEHDD